MLLKASGGTLKTLVELPIAEEWFTTANFALKQPRPSATTRDQR